jgi:hypothetical protein
LSVYDEISSTSYLSRKRRSRQERRGLKKFHNDERKDVLGGYFAPGDSLAHFTPASQQAPEELTLGPLTFRWHEEVLRIKTPTESHYLNKTQAAGLLGYLYDQRRTILKKSR